MIEGAPEPSIPITITHLEMVEQPRRQPPPPPAIPHAVMRAENITIYTVGFETSVNSTAIMKQCASSDSHHFDVDGDSIDDAFAAIARNIQKLRLMN